MRPPSLVLLGIVGLAFFSVMTAVVGVEMAKRWNATKRFDVVDGCFLAMLVGAACFFAWALNGSLRMFL